VLQLLDSAEPLGGEEQGGGKGRAEGSMPARLVDDADGGAASSAAGQAAAQQPVAVALRAQSAGELQALLGELEPHLLDVDGASPLGLPPAAGRVLLVSCGVGAPREDDLTLLQQARREGFAPALYTLNVRLDPRLGRRVRQAGVPHRGFDVFYELLDDVIGPRAAGG